MISTESIQQMHLKAITRDLLRTQADTLDQELIAASMKLNANGNGKTPALGKPLDEIQAEGSKRLNRLEKHTEGRK